MCSSCSLKDWVFWIVLIPLLILGAFTGHNICERWDARECSDQFIVSSTVSVTDPDKLADPEYHLVRLADIGQVSDPGGEILKKLHSSDAKLHSRFLHTPISQPPEQPCSNMVKCTGDTNLDPWLKNKLEEINKKIDSLKSKDPLIEQGNIEWCIFQPIDPHEDLIEAIQKVTTCVSRLITRVDVLERAIKEVPSKSDSIHNACPRKMPDPKEQAKEQAINDLAKCIDELLKHSRQLKETNGKTSSEDLLLLLFVGVGLVLGHSVATCLIIKKFMNDHYECHAGDGTNQISYDCRPEPKNIFNGISRLLANGAKQISEEERHYSNLRFALFTIFMATSGALGALHLNKEYVESTQLIHQKLPIIGMLLTLVFASLEFAIDWIETEYSYMGKAVWRYWSQHEGWLKNHDSVSIGGASPPMEWVRGPIWGIFVLAALLWIYLAECARCYALGVFFGLTFCFWWFLMMRGSHFAGKLNEKLQQDRL